MIGQEEDYRIEGFIESRVLSIWEMRNPVLMEKFVQAIFEMHHSSGTAQAIQSILPQDADNLGIDIAINQWGPATIARIANMRTKLIPSKAGHDRILAALDKLEATYLGAGYQDVLRSLVSREKIVFSHNDCQENNILSSLEDETKIFLIDYEYGMWNPQYYDLGNYLNEMICDNAYAKEPGIKYYMENWPKDDEIEYLTKQYMMLEKNDSTF